VLTAVAKALEEVAVKKALAQDEAAEWKHKYEMEVLRNSHLEHLLADNAALGSYFLLNNSFQCLEDSVFCLIRLRWPCILFGHYHSDTADWLFVCVHETALIHR